MKTVLKAAVGTLVTLLLVAAGDLHAAERRASVSVSATVLPNCAPPGAGSLDGAAALTSPSGAALVPAAGLRGGQDRRSACPVPARQVQTQAADPGGLLVTYLY